MFPASFFCFPRFLVVFFSTWQFPSGTTQRFRPWDRRVINFHLLSNIDYFPCCLYRESISLLAICSHFSQGAHSPTEGGPFQREATTGIVARSGGPRWSRKTGSFPRISPPFYFFAFLGPPLFSTNQAKMKRCFYFCWGPNSRQVVGSHSAVKLCRWTKSMLQGKGGGGGEWTCPSEREGRICHRHLQQSLQVSPEPWVLWGMSWITFLAVRIT